MNIIYKKHDMYPEHILIREFKGNIDVNNIIDSWEYLIKSKMINRQIKGVINDLSNCELIMDMNRFKTLISYMKSHDYFNGIKLAVITNSPKTIVFPTIGEKMVSEFSIRPFTTIQAAVDWIVMDI